MTAERSDSVPLAEVVQVLFLNLSWDARQDAKRMMTDEQRALLAVALDGEPNW